MLTDLEVTTIDCSGTKKREDGFFVDLSSGDIYLVSIVPDISFCIFDQVDTAINRLIPKSKFKQPFFSEKETGLNSKEKRKVLILRIKAPEYEFGEFSVGKAIVKRYLTFEEADSLKNDEEVKALFTLLQKENPDKNIQTKDAVNFSLWKMNSSAHSVMISHKIPFLSHFNGKISSFHGCFKINTPLRDVVSLVNMIQFIHFLEKGGIFFSKHKLHSLIHS